MADKKHILCPIDFSKGTPKIVQTAVIIAEQSSAKLTLLTIIEHLPLSTTFLAEVADIEKKAYDKLDKLVHDYDINNAQLKVISGYPITETYPKKAILDVAKALAVDLIVIGSHGHYSIAHHLLGSTTRFIANDANCDVYIVRC